MPLEEYRRKRDFARTPEPGGTPAGACVRGRCGGAVGSSSSAIGRPGSTTTSGSRSTASSSAGPCPRGPTLDPAERRMAIHVEDHPIEYLDFEGVIPAEQYGAGDVIVWDWGTWEPEAETPDPARAIARGELKFRLHGEKLRGRFTIVRTSGRKTGQRAFEADESEQWLLIHKRDEARGRRLGRRGPPGKRQDRPDERRGQGRPRRLLDQPGAHGRGRDRPVRRASRPRGRPGLPRADAGDPGRPPVRRPGLAVRDQVGRLPGRGHRRRR